MSKLEKVAGPVAPHSGNSAASPAEVAASWIDRHSGTAIALVMSLFFLATFSEAFRRPFWYDEMFTYSLAVMPDWHHIRAAMPPDGNPPLYVFLIRLVLPWLRPAELALRLPSLLAYTASLGLLFTFVRKRMGSVCGLLAALLLASHTFANYYASEARPYSLVLFFTCLGLVSWQRAADPVAPKRIFLVPLALSVGGIVLSHHIGIIGLGLALLCGESVRLVQRRRIDLGVIAAVLLGLCALLITLPMMHATSAAMLQDVAVNQPVSITRLITSYTDASLAWGRLFVCLLALAALVFFIQKKFKGLKRLQGEWPGYELAALLGGTATLVAVFVAIRISTGYYAGPRYGFAVFISLSALCAAIASLYPRSVQVVLCLMAVTNLPRPHVPRRAVSKEVSCLRSLPHETVAITRGFYYPTVWHYADPELRNRLFYPYGAEKEATGKRSIESSALILAKNMMMMKIEPFHQFLDSGTSFLAISDDTHLSDEAEFQRYLDSHGYRTEILASPECTTDGLTVERVSSSSSGESQQQ